MKKDCVWLMISDDKYELPLAVADTAVDLARMVGTTANAIRSSFDHYKHGATKSSRFRKVEIDDGSMEA